MQVYKRDLLLAGLIAISAISLPAFGQKHDREAQQGAQKSDEYRSAGEKKYMANCSGCHVLGQNIINPDKPIVASAKLVSRRMFKEFLGQEHGLMPKFEAISGNEEDLKDLYTFVKTLKHQSWEYDSKSSHPHESPMKEPEPRQNPEATP